MHSLKRAVNKAFYPFIALSAALILTGCLSEFLSCCLSVLISILIIMRISSKGQFHLKISMLSISLVLILLFYLISTIYALDPGMAFIGFVKFLPVVLFTILVYQYEDCRESLLSLLPYAALILGIVSFILMFANRSTFSAEGRLAGFFQYPETFAMFMLLGELICISKEKLNTWDIISAIALFCLITVTMSGIVFILAVLSNLLILFLKSGRKARIIIAGSGALFIILFILLRPMLKSNTYFGSFFSASVFENAVAERLLYCYDALPLIIKHPFGLGYMGYSYIQQSVQTGVYSVRYVHNDILQLFLDTGWIPAAAFIASIVTTFMSKDLSIFRKVIFGVFVVHILFDYDLQFTSMFMIFILLCDSKTFKEVTLSKGMRKISIAAAALGLLSIYFSLTLGMEYFKEYESSYRLYPANTQVKVQLIPQKENTSEQEILADSIINQNRYVPTAYSAKAKNAFSEGDFDKVMEYKNRIFEIAPFAYDEYVEYGEMLIKGFQMYTDAGDEEGANKCLKELNSLGPKLSSLENRLSFFGKMIEEQPKTQLPNRITITTEELNNSVKQN